MSADKPSASWARICSVVGRIIGKLWLKYGELHETKNGGINAQNIRHFGRSIVTLIMEEEKKKVENTQIKHEIILRFIHVVIFMAGENITL